MKRAKSKRRTKTSGPLVTLNPKQLGAIICKTVKIALKLQAKRIQKALKGALIKI